MGNEFASYWANKQKYDKSNMLKNRINPAVPDSTQVNALVPTDIESQLEYGSSIPELDYLQNGSSKFKTPGLVAGKGTATNDLSGSVFAEGYQNPMGEASLYSYGEDGMITGGIDGANLTDSQQAYMQKFNADQIKLNNAQGTDWMGIGSLAMEGIGAGINVASYFDKKKTLGLQRDAYREQIADSKYARGHHKKRVASVNSSFDNAKSRNA